MSPLALESGKDRAISRNDRDEASGFVGSRNRRQLERCEGTNAPARCREVEHLIRARHTINFGGVCGTRRRLYGIFTAVTRLARSRVPEQQHVVSCCDDPIDVRREQAA